MMFYSKVNLIHLFHQLNKLTTLNDFFVDSGILTNKKYLELHGNGNILILFYISL